MARGYVFVDTEVGKGQQVRDQFLHTKGIVAADLVMGPHDLVVVIEQPTIEEVGRVVVRDLHGTPGVKNTITMIVINRD
jgi:DNA-binding Lrp family transcriptional regulator